MLNYRFIFRQLAMLTGVLSLSMLVIATWSAFVWAGQSDSELIATEALFSTVALGVVASASCWLIGRRGTLLYLGRREAMLLVAASWFLGAGLGAVPYFVWARLDPNHAIDHRFTSFVACYFESMSGFTTTGASVLSNVEALPRALVLWRSTTHWLGGLGIVVLFVAVLPSLGVGGKRLFAAEVTGPTATGVRPRISEAARTLWLIYVGLTIVQTVLLAAFGMSWFDAINHTFATLATGGFSTRNASIGAYDSWAIDLTIVVFMILAGVNFGLYYQALRGRWSTAARDAELRLYLMILLVASVLVCSHLVTQRLASTRLDPGDPQTQAMIEPSVPAAIRHGVFQVVSIQTTTGFATADFDQWPFIPKAVLLTLMFIGGCAGSTGGGIKVIRLLIAAKVIAMEIERVFRPNVVRAVHAGKAAIPAELRQETLVYILLVLGLFLLGAVAIHLIEGGGGHDFVTAATASAATLNNIGPGLEAVGAVRNYGFFSAPSLALMSVLMCLGRLEVYAIVVLFLPRFWRPD